MNRICMPKWTLNAESEIPSFWPTPQWLQVSIGEIIYKNVVYMYYTERLLKKAGCIRAYPGSEFVVAYTLAKWKKLEPNEINFSQGFSQKVSTSCFVITLCPLCLLITFANSFDPDQVRQNVGPDLDPNCLTPGWY